MECPLPTQDQRLNARNRRRAANRMGYGPMEEGDEFWQDKADMWNVTVSEAKTRRCGNCKVFNQTKEMRDCIGGDDMSVGYCESLNFMCSAQNTCDAWAPADGPKSDPVMLYLNSVNQFLTANQKKSIREGSFVEWNSSGGKARGKVEHVMYEGVLGVPDSKFSINASEDNPAVLIRIWKDKDGVWDETETLVGHRMSTLKQIDSLLKKS